MGAAIQSARAGRIAVFHDERRPREDTTLYQVLQEELDTFLAQVEAHTRSSLPQFVKDEFEAFRRCGIISHGFVRLRCAECAHEQSIALLCKRLGFCTSCGARRMAE